MKGKIVSESFGKLEKLDLLVEIIKRIKMDDSFNENEKTVIDDRREPVYRR